MFDIVGILILIVVIAVFGFLITRAWKLKNAFLKWVGMFLTGLPGYGTPVPIISGSILSAIWISMLGLS